MKNSFKFPMKKSEKIIGCICIPVHAAFLPLLLLFIYDLAGLTIDSSYQTLIHYTLSFLILIGTMMRFLRASFSDFIENFFRTVQAVILGYAMYFVLSWLLTKIIGAPANPNTTEVVSEVKQNVKVMIAVSGVLAPIVEETIFRGALFGTIRQKSRIAAYIVSIFIFALYHLWQFFITGFDWGHLVYMLQYVPAGIALAWSYEYANTVWSPILLHAVINFIILTQYL